METGLLKIISFIFSIICLICGILLWRRRKETSDGSRNILSIIFLLLTVCCIIYLTSPFGNSLPVLSHILLDPMMVIIGLWAINLFICYPIEVMRPRQLRGWWQVLVLLPSLLATLTLVSGLQFQELLSWSDLLTHIGDIDVVFRLVCLFLLTIISLFLLVIPYNWRNSSADYRWIRKITFISQVTTFLYYGNTLTSLPLFFYLHLAWVLLTMVYLTCYELGIRVLPPTQTIQMPVSSPSISAPHKHVNIGDLWPRICQIMDECEEWRNPNATVETLSRAIGTNRIYVAKCIREHTGLTFNDYLNKKRIDFLVLQLRQDPSQDHKSLYFEAGFRSRHTVYRNFVKFMGCSPSDFIASL